MAEIVKWTTLTSVNKYLIHCPKCDQLIVLEDHSILPDGKVVPSVECPFKGCDFLGFVTLEDFE